MAKRVRSPDRVDGGKRPRHSRKHLYVALDDCENGYSIHKVDAEADGVGIADPPLLRLDSLGEASRGVLVGALGSKILALWQPTADGHLTTHAVAYGTDTDRLDVGPPHPDALLTMRFVVAAGERLYALHEGGLHCLELVLDETLPSGAEDSEAGEHRWAWTRVSSPLRLPGCGGDPEDDDAPIEITSYALHPDGRTIFVSAHATRRGGYAGTFSLDTALASPGGDAEWTPCGEWLLPFQGQGHYDAGLDAWVGLHSPGYMCACDVPAPLTNERYSEDAPRQPTWELVSAASLLYADPDPKAGDSAAWLVGMGGGQFCVVESMALAEAEQEDGHVLLRLATLRVERDRLHGGLRASSRRTLACRVLKFDPLFSRRAFCM